jgi:acetyl-CoA carboxylase carboxyl transferase subunit beta
MAWFTRSEKPGRKKSLKEDIWTRCGNCHAHVFKQDWIHNLNVCPKCNYHGKLTAYERIGTTIDAGTFQEINETVTAGDPLNFIDSKGGYDTKVADARLKTGLNEAVVTGTGTIEGISVVIAVMDFRFMGGSLGSATGEKILRAANMAWEKGIPYIIFSASGGARMHEGTLSLMQMAKTCAGIARLDQKKVPYISVMTDPTTGGVSASFATVGDINLAEPGALIGFAGRRVIEQTIRQKLPSNFQTAEYLLEHGFVDAIVNRKDLKKTLKQILFYYNR